MFRESIPMVVRMLPCQGVLGCCCFPSIFICSWRHQEWGQFSRTAVLTAPIASSTAALRHRCQCCWGIGVAAATTMAAMATFKVEQPTHLQRRGIISDTALEELSAHSALGPIYAFYIAAIMECNTCSGYHRGWWRQCHCCSNNNSSNGGNSISNNNKNNRDSNWLQQSQQINYRSETLSSAKVKDNVIVDKQFSAILSKLMDRQLSYLWTNNCLLW